jgi:hypothetical protein
MLKHSLLALTLAGLIYAAPAVAQNDPQSGAQSPAPDQQSAPAGGHQWRGHGHVDPAQRTEMLTKKLNLTADQQPKVQDIFKSEQSQMQALRNDSSISGNDRRTKMMDIHKASADQVRALLDSTQQKKWDEMQTNRTERRGRRHGGENPPSGSGL